MHVQQVRSIGPLSLTCCLTWGYPCLQHWPLSLTCCPTWGCPSCLQGVYVLGSHEQGAEPGLEGAPRPLMEAVLDYLQGERQKLRQRMAADLAAAAEADIARGQQQQQQQQEVDSHHLQLQQQQEPEPEEGGARTSHWQRKITPLDRGLAVTDPWAAVLGTPALAAASRGSCSPGDSWVGGDLAEGDAAAALREVQAGRRAAAAARQQLVVVASLVDRLPNLAGLARTCEVFRWVPWVCGWMPWLCGRVPWAVRVPWLCGCGCEGS